MSIPYDYDIAIIGDGITGLSAALHLQKLGFARLCLFSRGLAKSATVRSAGFISGGLADNFTRLSHPRGEGIARSVWNFADLAYDSLMEYLDQSAIPYTTGERLRWIISEAEAAEAKKAVKQLQSLGLEGSWHLPANPHQAGLTSPRLMGIQNEGTRAAWVSTAALLQHLWAETAVKTFGEAQSFQSRGGLIEVHHSGGSIRSEFLICAQHLSMGTLLPNLAEALVPYADQWDEYRLRNPKLSFPWKAGTVFSWQHSHIWGVITGETTVHIGGGRYLRPMAGIEASESRYEPKITKHLEDAWNGLWPDFLVDATRLGSSSRDCRPCDELPLIGPMFGDSRVLIGTGYMGQGLSLGFMAGRCLAELIADRPNQLPRLLWPERLRSLPSETEEAT